MMLRYMEQNWKDYLSFTQKERRGIWVLLVLIGISNAVPHFIPEKKMDEVLLLKEIEDTVTVKPRQPQLFTFNPNTLDSAGWLKLGIHQRSIRTIRNYVRKGGRFRKPEDLERIYGFRKEDYERLMPFIRIPDTSKKIQDTSKPRYENKKTAPTIIDINTADTAAFIALPGIGSKLANRIIAFREKLGGFYTVEQLAETYGLRDSIFQKIKPRLKCTAGHVRKININTADANTLKQHPYLKWPIANAIVQYRQQHGEYKELEDLKQIAILPPELYDKILPYISLE